MPINSEIFSIDPKSYSISVKLDQDIENFMNTHDNTLNKDLKDFKNTIMSHKKLKEIFTSFDYPPQEIIDQLTNEGYNELLKYYNKQKQFLLEKYCNNMLLSFYAISAGFEINSYIQNIKNKFEQYNINTINSKNSEIKILEYSKSYNFFYQNIYKVKNNLINNNYLLTKEKKYLFEIFETEVKKLYIKPLVNNLLEAFILQMTNKYKNIIQKINSNNKNDILKQIIMALKLNQIYMATAQTAYDCLTHDKAYATTYINKKNDELAKQYNITAINKSDSTKIFDYVRKKEQNINYKDKPQNINAELLQNIDYYIAKNQYSNNNLLSKKLLDCLPHLNELYHAS